MSEKAASHSIRFRLAITADRYLAYYQGKAQNILVRAEDGRKIKFPANNLRQFLQHDGIFGLFEISFDSNNKLSDLKRLGN